MRHFRTIRLWKACGIENRLAEFLLAKTEWFHFGAAFLGFKRMNSNQLGNSSGINMRNFRVWDGFGDFGDLHILHSRRLGKIAAESRKQKLDRASPKAEKLDAAIEILNATGLGEPRFRALSLFLAAVRHHVFLA